MGAQHPCLQNKGVWSDGGILVTLRLNPEKEKVQACKEVGEKRGKKASTARRMEILESSQRRKEMNIYSKEIILTLR